MSVLPYLVAAWVFLVGCYGLATSRNLIHAVGCLAVCQSATTSCCWPSAIATAAPRPSSPT